MPAEALLLGFGLGGDKAHAGGVQGGEDGFGIAVVVFDALVLAVGFDEFGGYEAGFEIQGLQGTGPVMGAAAGFHGNLGAARQALQPGEKFGTFERGELAAMTVGITDAGGKDVLCQINCDCRSCLLYTSRCV